MMKSRKGGWLLTDCNALCLNDCQAHLCRRESRQPGVGTGFLEPQQSLIRITLEYIAFIGPDDSETEKVSYDENGAWPGFNSNEPFYELGTLDAVYNFLEEFFGTRWYMVTELGTVIPKRCSFL